jgi:hypothetical protein
MSRSISLLRIEAKVMGRLVEHSLGGLPSLIMGIIIECENELGSSPDSQIWFASCRMTQRTGQCRQ